MSTTPVLASATAGKPANARTVMAHHPALREQFDKMYATLWGRGSVGEDVKELVRLRNARITDCGL
jgi:hypothetical protein